MGNGYNKNGENQNIKITDKREINKNNSKNNNKHKKFQIYLWMKLFH